MDQAAWAHLQPTPGLDGIHLRYIEGDDGRVRITGVYLHGEELVTSQLREIPLSRYADQIQSYLARVRAIAAKLGTTVDETAKPADETNSITVAELEAFEVMPQGQQTDYPSLERLPEDTSLDFYRRVAAAYRLASAETRAPAALLAKRAGVNPRTVHFWIREARRLGELPPGRQGKAG